SADDVLVLQPGELERVLADVEDPPVLVAGEKGRLGRRVVVVEKLEQKAEAAFRASLGSIRETRGALPRLLPVPAIRADEEGHVRSLARVRYVVGRWVRSPPVRSPQS